jgi:hypothetical protein
MFSGKLALSINNSVGWKLLRNRGRSRAFVSGRISSYLNIKLAHFLSGSWVPESKVRESRYPVSLTSWGPRLTDLPLVLISLLQQSVFPSAIYVWLSVDDRNSLDQFLINRFSSYGVHFETCDNLGPHTKWLPIIERGATEPFVICDDDILYPRRWLESLIREDRFDAYVGSRCHKIKYDSNGYPLPYSNWEHDIAWDGSSSDHTFVTACAGAVIHPGRIGSEFRDRKRIMGHAPKADDIWIKAAHAAAGVPCYKTRFSFPCLEIPGTGATSLMQTNVDAGGNDRQLSAVKHWLMKAQHDSGFSARFRDA